MIWLTEEDINGLIKEDVLEQVLDEVSEEDDDPLKDVAERFAIAEVTDAINVRYDTDTIFSTSGNNRPQSILRVVIDLFLYHLHARVPAHDIPEIRRIRYEDAIKWLDKVALGKIAPKNLPYPKDDAKGNLDVWGLFSDRKFESDYNKWPTGRDFEEGYGPDVRGPGW